MNVSLLLVSEYRGNHETPGTWAFGRFTNDVLDLEVVVDYLAREFGYIVDMVVGHSRGSVVGMLWLCKHRDGAAKDATRYVNVSGRYRMEVGRPFPVLNTRLLGIYRRKYTVSV